MNLQETLNRLRELLEKATSEPAWETKVYTSNVLASKSIIEAISSLPSLLNELEKALQMDNEVFTFIRNQLWVGDNREASEDRERKMLIESWLYHVQDEWRTQLDEALKLWEEE